MAIIWHRYCKEIKYVEDKTTLGSTRRFSWCLCKAAKYFYLLKASSIWRNTPWGSCADVMCTYRRLLPGGPRLACRSLTVEVEKHVKEVFGRLPNNLLYILHKWVWNSHYQHGQGRNDSDSGTVVTYTSFPSYVGNVPSSTLSGWKQGAYLC